MALPVMNTAKYEMELPSTGDKIEYRPFLVKEEKVLLQAMEGGDEKEIMRGLKQVISQCVLTKDYKIDRPHGKNGQIKRYSSYGIGLCSNGNSKGCSLLENGV